MGIMAKIGFVVLSWNSAGYIEQCIRSICECRNIKSYVCVVDNGSTDRTVECIRSLELQREYFKLDIIELPVNRGTTISRNLGIQRIPVEYNYICILDSDTVVNEEALAEMVNILAASPQNGIVGPALRGLNGKPQLSGRRIPLFWIKLVKAIPLHCLQIRASAWETPQSIDKICPVGYLMSACWLVKREVFQNIGLLDEKIFYAPEDVEFCIRAWYGGYRVLYDSQVSIIHAWQRISRKKLFSYHNFEHIKGLFYLYKKYDFWFSAKKIERLIR